MPADSTPTNETLITGPHALTAGAIINDRYRVDYCLASGGYGDVWAGVNVENGDWVAVKLLRTDAGNNDPSALARMRQEAEILQAIEHPNIVKVYEFGASPFGQFLVMELLEGLAIDQLLQTEGPATVERAIPIVRQLLLALQAAHRKEILHRDIKPENIILVKNPETHDEVAKLVDFGIAKAHRLLSDNDSGVTLVQTRMGGFVGTPRYAAPEQAVGDPIGPSADLFALGLVLAEWLSGKARFDGERHAEVMSQLLSPDPIDISDTPWAFQNWLRKMLDKDVRTRFQDAHEALTEFESVVVAGSKRADFLESDHNLYPTDEYQKNRQQFSDDNQPLELDYEAVERSRRAATAPPSNVHYPVGSISGEDDKTTEMMPRSRPAPSKPMPLDERANPPRAPQEDSNFATYLFLVVVFIASLFLGYIAIGYFFGPGEDPAAEQTAP